jgi:DNA-binding MarR family transcriptional regulator
LDIHTLELAPIIMDLSRMIHRINSRELEFLRLGAGQKRLLKVVLENPGLTQSALSRHLAVNRSTVCRAIQSLEALRYIRRAKNPGDPPGRHIHGTRLGRFIFRSAHHSHDFVEMQLADGFTREEYTCFAQYLLRAKQHLARPPWDSLTPFERMQKEAMVAMARGKYDTFHKYPVPLADPSEGP